MTKMYKDRESITKYQKLLWLAILIFLIVFLSIYVLLNFSSQETLYIPNGETITTITGEIRDIIIQDELTTLYLEINEKVVAVNLQKNTLLQDATGKNCTYLDLKAGLMIEAVVNPTVMYDAWQDSVTGKQLEINVYYKCYKILIK